MESALEIFTKHLSEYTYLATQLLDLRVAVENLLNGILTPSLVNVPRIHAVITQVKMQLRAHYPGFKLVFDTPASVYHLNDYVFTQHGSHLVLQLN